MADDSELNIPRVGSVAARSSTAMILMQYPKLKDHVQDMETLDRHRNMAINEELIIIRTISGNIRGYYDIDTETFTEGLPASFDPERQHVVRPVNVGIDYGRPDGDQTATFERVNEEIRKATGIDEVSVRNHAEPGEQGLNFSAVVGGTPAQREAALDVLDDHKDEPETCENAAVMKREGRAIDYETGEDKGEATFEETLDVQYTDMDIEERTKLAQLINYAIEDIFEVMGVKGCHYIVKLQSTEERLAELRAGMEADAEQITLNDPSQAKTQGDRVLMELNKAALEGKLKSMHFAIKGGLSMHWADEG